MPDPVHLPTGAAEPDAAAAQALAIALEALADGLTAVLRSDADRVADACLDWQGFTRTWFDRHHAAATHDLRAAAARARQGADEVVVAVLQAASS